MTALYNEIEPFAAEWMENLIAKGYVAPGKVYRRSITDLTPADLQGVTQAHFFAGIAVWSYALRLAGWPDDLPVWTGSCPCQPFSSAGQRKGFDDARHLWPSWFRLIRECRPPIIFGEQVASDDGLVWLDSVLSDLEGEGYACGASDLCAAGVGAPHRRQRLYFVAVAHSYLQRCDGLGLQLRGRGPREDLSEAARSGAPGSLAHSDGFGLKTRGEGRQGERGRPQPGWGRAVGAVGDSGCERSWWDSGPVPGPEDQGEGEGSLARRVADLAFASGSTRGFWAGCEWVYCTDGKWRSFERGSFPLASRSPGRVGRVHAYGNAIVAPLAATFIRAVMEVLNAA